MFLRYSNFCPEFFLHTGTRFDKKAQVSFKIYDAINWKTNNYNRLIA